MGQLLNLADEILLEIVSHLAPTSPAPLSDHPFFLEEKNEAAIEQIETLFSVTLTCRQLHRVAIGRLYRHIHASWERAYVLLYTLRNSQHLSVHVRSIDITVDKGGLDIWEPFSYPNIDTICLRDLNGSYSWYSKEDCLPFTSPVRVLKLIRCRTAEDTLARILSCPKALKELWYDLDGWSDEAPGPSDRYTTTDEGFSCAAVERALQNQADHLEKFVFTDSRKSRVNNAYGDVLDIHHYSKLKSLCLNDVFLKGVVDVDNVDVWERLPKSLQELEVYHYEHSWVHPFAYRFDMPLFPNWLVGILDKIATNKNEDVAISVSAPLLERIRLILLDGNGLSTFTTTNNGSTIVTMHGGPSPWLFIDPMNTQRPDPGWEDPDPLEEQNEMLQLEREYIQSLMIEERGVRHLGSDWRPPPELMQKIIRAGVSLSIFLDCHSRYRYVPEGCPGFQDTWEDTWDPQLDLDRDTREAMGWHNDIGFNDIGFNDI
ncbi:hypothetical protein F4819DRAFT_112499 [Hypoxylon fuscum]|nr:hypothetical protein F4819DRAFT_112499 [Hypoxylon fuscum]